MIGNTWRYWGADPHLFEEDDTVCWTGAPADPFVRPAGPLFRHRGMLLRPSQNCSDGYGIGLRFNQVLEVRDDHYQERFLTEISPDQIQSDWSLTPSRGYIPTARATVTRSST